MSGGPWVGTVIGLVKCTYKLCGDRKAGRKFVDNYKDKTPPHMMTNFHQYKHKSDLTVRKEHITINSTRLTPAFAGIQFVMCDSTKTEISIHQKKNLLVHSYYC